MKITTRESGLVASLLKPINTAAIILLGVYTVIWGLWLVNPFWDVFTSAPLFREMNSLFPEWLWGLIAITCGVITVYGAYRPSYHALTTGSSVAFAHWFIISIFYFIGDWHNTGGITALTFATYAAFVYLNIRVNYRSGHMKINEIVP